MDTFATSGKRSENNLCEIGTNECSIENHLLFEKDDYFKSLYLRMLCVLISCSGDVTEMQISYMRSMISDIKAEDDLETYMKLALNLEKKIIDDFVYLLRDDSLKYYFFLDCLILLSLRKKDEKDYNLLIEFIELLGIMHREIKYLSAVAKAIVCQSIELFNAAKKSNVHSLNNLSLYPYLLSFYTGEIIGTHESCHIYSYNKDHVEISVYSPFKSKSTILENITVSVEDDLVFWDCDEVIIRKCRFNKGAGRLVFHGVRRVIIEDCEVTGFYNQFASFHNVDYIMIQRNCFYDCGRAGVRDILGGVFYSSGEKCECITLVENKITSCFVERDTWSRGYSATGIFFHMKNKVMHVEIVRNRFTDCKCRNNGTLFEDAYITGNIDSLNSDENTCIGSVKNVVIADEVFGMIG